MNRDLLRKGAMIFLLGTAVFISSRIVGRINGSVG